MYVSPEGVLYINPSKMHAAFSVRSNHLLAVLLGNAMLWIAALVVSGNVRLAVAAAVALMSIASLAHSRRQVD
jgi:hypothetical protein